MNKSGDDWRTQCWQEASTRAISNCGAIDRRFHIRDVILQAVWSILLHTSTKMSLLMVSDAFQSTFQPSGYRIECCVHWRKNYIGGM